jgi:hypothetical protein
MDICYDVALARIPPEFTSELCLLILGAGHAHKATAGNTGYIVPAACPLTKLWLPSNQLNLVAA